MILNSSKTLKPKYQSIGVFIRDFSQQHPNLTVLMAKNQGRFEALVWASFMQKIYRVMHCLIGWSDKTPMKAIFFSPNCAEMLISELAVMASGHIAVPLFFGYKETRVNELVDFSEGDLLFVANEERLKLIHSRSFFKKIVHFEPVRDSSLVEELGDKLVSFSSIQDIILSDKEQQLCDESINQVTRDQWCLLMYTSGTMSLPKGVRLTHENILSQQEALQDQWGIQPGGTMLSYLPWHHSFGGIFELFFALYSGTSMALDDSLGKHTALLLENWEKVKPHFFFSVPKVFYELISKTMSEPKFQRIVFHPDLKFVFTAGAPLASSISDVFKAKDVPVYEGWGLTETSPCCTLTDGKAQRIPGFVGRPIAGVSIKHAEDEEILVKGPNVMLGYYKNEESTRAAFTEEGWFKTGDIGKVTENGVTILTRKDRIFKLLNAEKVNPAGIENNLLGHCPMIKHVLVFGKGFKEVAALVFPNMDDAEDEICASKPECTERKTKLNGFPNCLDLCVELLNRMLVRQYERLHSIIILKRELEIEKGELTPSMKVNPNKVYENFQHYIDPLIDPNLEKPEDATYIRIV